MKVKIPHLSPHACAVVRYWDVEREKSASIVVLEDSEVLPSDCRYREDMKLLAARCATLHVFRFHTPCTLLGNLRVLFVYALCFAAVHSTVCGGRSVAYFVRAVFCCICLVLCGVRSVLLYDMTLDGHRNDTELRKKESRRSQKPMSRA